MKILLSAYSCGAAKTSEPGVAWRAIHHALAENHEVWTISEKHCETAMMAYLADHPLPGYHPVFFQVSPLIAKIRRPGVRANIYYYLWQNKLLSVARELHQKIGFDLAHHVTFARYWSPSGVRNLGIPFIWGPVGAAESAPPAFLSEMALRDRLFEFARDRTRQVSHRDPALRATARAATIAIGISRESCEALRSLGARRVEQLPLSLDDDDLNVFESIPPPPSGPFRVICMGRLLHWKGFYLAIRAFAIFARKNPEAELWLVGSGPFQRELEKTAAQTGTASCVRFWGQLSHAAAMDKLSQAHVLLHPALHDNFPGVCLEAMAAGRPVICLDIGGPAFQVTPETGFIVPATTPAESVEKLAAALSTLANDRVLLARMSVAARARVRQEFTASRTGAAMSNFYAQAVASHAESRGRKP